MYPIQKTFKSLFFAVLMLFSLFFGLSGCNSGGSDEAASIVERMDQVSQEYPNDLSTSFKYELNTNLLMECRQLDDARADDSGVGHDQGLLPAVYIGEWGVDAPIEFFF